jgi:hypothetical protein
MCRDEERFCGDGVRPGGVHQMGEKHPSFALCSLAAYLLVGRPPAAVMKKKEPAGGRRRRPPAGQPAPPAERRSERVRVALARSGAARSKATDRPRPAVSVCLDASLGAWAPSLALRPTCVPASDDHP